MQRKTLNGGDAPIARTDVLVIGLVLAFTAVPMQVRLPGSEAVFGAFFPPFVLVDFVVNILGCVPLGMALANRPLRRALALAVVVSVSAEVTQLFSVGRTPSVLDVVANLMGAGLGLLLARRWRAFPPGVPVTRSLAMAAAAAAIAYLAFGSGLTAERLPDGLKRLDSWITTPPWMASNPRGAVDRGILEAYWPMDALESDRVVDVSGNGLDGAGANAPTLTAGVVGPALSLNGNQWIDLGRPVALRLTGSTTVSAWVNPRAFPVDDAVLLSSTTPTGLGYQLDLTVDTGKRTVALKIADASGRLAARYGRTPLTTDQWYHVAGVYDATSRTLDVYLNGERDNGCLRGTVTAHQRASGAHVFIGRRPRIAGFEFNGSIDDAKVYSRPLSASEVRSEVIALRPALSQMPPAPDLRGGTGVGECHFVGVPPRLAGPLVSFGMLVALACLGLWRGRNAHALAFVACLLAGTAASLTTAGIALGQAWEPILFTLAGGMIVAVATWQGQRGAVPVRSYPPDIRSPRRRERPPPAPSQPRPGG